MSPVRVSIHHTSAYRFSRAVAFNPHRLILRPQSELGLDVLSHSFAISPTPELVWSTDVFGNCIATATFAGAATDLVIESRSVVEATSPDWPIYAIEPRVQQHPFRYSADEAAALGVLLSPDVDEGPVAEWAHRFVARPETDTLSLLKDLNGGVAAQICYAPRSEENTQSAGETLGRRRGACRDLAQLFLASARSLGFGARAVTGYLLDSSRTGGADATHAWAEVYIPGPGWIAFDPTNGRMGAAGLVKVAVGRSSAQVLPIVGSYVGDPSDYVDLEVAVRSATHSNELTLATCPELGLAPRSRQG
jgi:transglutaminase-like putative cysteine protease